MYISWFKQIAEDSLETVGGKGQHLATMVRQGLPVPQGFVITTAAYKKFLQEAHLTEKIAKILAMIRVDNTEQLQRLSKEIRDLIEQAPVPLEIIDEIMDNYELFAADLRKAHDLVEADEVFVAVRSSATAEDLPQASFAGQQATFLNIKGKKEVVRYVRSCWASLFSARAIYYRAKHNFPHEKVFMAVVVQRMINAQQSGVLFTINPVTNDEKEVIIEAVNGLGEALVSGQLTPDHYVVAKETGWVKTAQAQKQEWGYFCSEKGEIVKEQIPTEEQEKRVLHDNYLAELTRLGKKLEKFYGKPQDVEWAIANKQIYLLQTRPVTTFS